MPYIETTVSETTVWLRLADAEDPEQATDWLDAQMPYDLLRRPRASDTPLGDPSLQYFGEIQIAALIHVRDAISAEIQRLNTLANP